MAGINVGSVGVTVYPETEQFWSRFRAQTQPGADQAGRRLGQDLSNSIPRQLSQAVTRGLQTNAAGAQGRRAGDNFADAFDRQVITKIEAALRSLPTNIRVDANTSPALAELQTLRAALELENSKIGLGVSPDEGTVARLAALRTQLDALAASSPDIRIRVDSAAASAQLASFAAQVEAVNAALGDGGGPGGGGGSGGFGGGRGMSGRIKTILSALTLLGPALIPIGAAGVAAFSAMGIAAGAAGLAIYGLWSGENKAAQDAFNTRLDVTEQTLKRMSSSAAGQFMTGLADGFDKVNQKLPAFSASLSSLARDMGLIAGNVGQGMLAWAQAFLPTAFSISAVLVRWSDSFANIGQSKAFQDFVAYAMQEGPVVARMFGELADAVVRILQAFEPWGSLIIQAITTFSQVVNAIPLPVLQALALILESYLTYRAVGVILGGIATGLDKIKTAATGATLAQTGQSAAGAAGGLRSFAAAGGLANVVTAGLTAGLLGYLFIQQKNAEETAKHTAVLNSYAAAVKTDAGVIGEATQAQIAQNLAQNGAVQAAQKYGISIQTLTAAAEGNRDAQKQIADATNGNVKAMEALLGPTLAQSEAISEQIQIYKDGGAALGAFANSGDAALKVYTASVAALGTQSGITKVMINGTTFAMNEQTDAASVLSTAIDNLTGKNLTAAEAQAAFQTATFGLTDAVTANGVSLDINTKAGAANQQTLLGLIGQINSTAEAAFKATGNTADFSASVDQNSQRLYDAATAAGFNKDEVAALIEKYKAVPDKVNTVITANTSSAQAQVDQLLGKLREVEIVGSSTSGVRTDMYLGPAQGNAEGGYITGPGTGTSDSIMSRLSNGEYVVRAAAVSAVGVPFLNTINAAGSLPPARRGSYMNPRTGYAAGGVVNVAAGSSDSLAGEVRALREEMATGLNRLAAVTAGTPQQVGREVGLRIGAGGSRRTPAAAS